MLNKKFKNIPVALFVFAILCPLSSAAFPVKADSLPHVDVKSLIFEHVKDSYEWHITTWNGKRISIYLPIIVYSERIGWNVFSSKMLHGNSEYRGFRIASKGNNEGKIVEYEADGKEVRPLFDFSVTKTVFAIFLNALLLIIIVLCVACSYRRRKDSGNLSVPKGFIGVFEMLVLMVVDEIAKPNIGKGYERYLSYLLTVFFFIFLSNIMGIVPFFPGGSNVTGNIAVTMVLAFCTFLAVNIFGSKEYWKEIFWPNVPLWLKVPIPLMPFIELFGIFVKPFALTIRLFANIFAGHVVVLAFVSIIFVSMEVNKVIGGAMTVMSVLFAVFIDFLELLVAFIQAFVFTMLSSVFIGLSQSERNH